jgi:membrane-associated phospholipid phosphatase
MASRSRCTVKTERNVTGAPDRATTWHRRPVDAVVFGASGAVVLVAAMIAARGVSNLEATLFHAVNDLPDWLYRPMWLAQYLGLLLLPLGVAVIAAALRRWRLAVGLVLLVPLKLLVEKGVLKQLLYRARPGTSVCDKDPACLHLRGDVPLVGPSFPSGHVIIAFGIAWLVAPYVGHRARWALAATCAAVVLARMYLGAHNPLDVLAGAASGIAIAAALNLMLGVPNVGAGGRDGGQPVADTTR